MPFGCVASGADWTFDPTFIEHVRSPMPFGCVASGALHAYGVSAEKLEKSPMPFGCVASGASQPASFQSSLVLRLQCLSAVWLLVPRKTPRKTPRPLPCLQCLSAVWLLVPLTEAKKQARRYRSPMPFGCVASGAQRPFQPLP